MTVFFVSADEGMHVAAARSDLEAAPPPGRPAIFCVVEAGEEQVRQLLTIAHQGERVLRPDLGPIRTFMDTRVELEDGRSLAFGGYNEALDFDGSLWRLTDPDYRSLRKITEQALQGLSCVPV